MSLNQILEGCLVPLNVQFNDVVVEGTPVFNDLTASSAVYVNASKELASAALTNGQVLIGRTSNTPVAAALTAGANIAVTNGSGSVSIAYSPNSYNTYTPEVFFAGANVGMTYSSRAAKYMVVGKCVMFIIEVQLNAKGSSTGNAQLKLPSYDIVGIDPVLSSNVVISYIANIDGTPGWAGTIAAAGTVINLFQSIDSLPVAAITDTSFTDTTGLRLTGFYFIA